MCAMEEKIGGSKAAPTRVKQDRKEKEYNPYSKMWE
jgi:hypothetical protein